MDHIASSKARINTVLVRIRTGAVRVLCPSIAKTRVALLCLCLVSYTEGSHAEDDVDYKMDVYMNPTSDHHPEFDLVIFRIAAWCSVRRQNPKHRLQTCSEALRDKILQLSEHYELESFLRNNRFECKNDTKKPRVFCRRDFVIIDRPAFLFQTPIQEVHDFYQITVRFPRNSELPVRQSQIEVSFDEVRRSFPLD